MHTEVEITVQTKKKRANKCTSEQTNKQEKKQTYKKKYRLHREHLFSS